MATLATGALTLADFAKRLGPDNKIAAIIELLSQTNEVLSDMVFLEANGLTSHRTTQRTTLPTPTWRQLNQGVAPSKSTTAQIDDACAMLEAWSEVDVELADLSSNAAAFRLSEAQAFIEGMNQEMVQTLFYGNSGLAPEEFTGFSTRYNSLTANNAQNIISAGGAGSDNSSIWLICWGPQTVHGIYPKGTKAGLSHEDRGRETAETTAGIAGNRMLVYRDKWNWKTGLTVRDWRYAVRIANIDISNNNADLSDLMIQASHRIPAPGMGTMAFYMNRTLYQRLDLLRKNDVTAGGGLTYESFDGQGPVGMFRGIPVRKVDALLETESAVT